MINLFALYTQLCDFTRPGILGVRSFVQVHGDHPDGRRQQYTHKETLKPGDAYNLLTALLWSMRGGHTNAALMYCGEVGEAENGFNYTTPDSDSDSAIREQFLLYSYLS